MDEKKNYKYYQDTPCRVCGKMVTGLICNECRKKESEKLVATKKCIVCGELIFKKRKLDPRSWQTVARRLITCSRDCQSSYSRDLLLGGSHHFDNFTAKEMKQQKIDLEKRVDFDLWRRGLKRQDTAPVRGEYFEEHN